jgi:hypothetical protein
MADSVIPSWLEHRSFLIGMLIGALILDPLAVLIVHLALELAL